MAGFYGLRSRPFAALAGLIAGVAVMLAGPALAGADTTYPGGNATTFAQSDGGWVFEDSYAGVCVPGVTCPKLSGERRDSDGAGGPGDGYLELKSGPITVATLLSTSTGTWTSPEFTYRGAGGQAPDSLQFSMSVRSGLQALLNLGATAGYTVSAISSSGGSDVTLIEAGGTESADAWSAVNQGLDRGALAIGAKYRIRISYSVGGLAAVLPSGKLDFDDVAITAARSSGGNGGNGGGNGATKPPPAVIPPGKAFYHNGKLFLRVKCPKRFRPVCRIKAFVVTKRRHGKLITRRVNVRVKRGKFKRKALVVKPKFRKRMLKLSKVNQKTVFLKMKIRSKKIRKKKNRKARVVFHHLKVRARH